MAETVKTKTKVKGKIIFLVSIILIFFIFSLVNSCNLRNVHSAKSPFDGVKKEIEQPITKLDNPVQDTTNTQTDSTNAIDLSSNQGLTTALDLVLNNYLLFCLLIIPFVLFMPIIRRALR